MNQKQVLPFPTDQPISTDNNSFDTHATTSTKRNFKFESMRASIKNSLFSFEKNSVFVEKMSFSSQIDFSTRQDPPEVQNQGEVAIPSRNPNMDKYRRMIKANLFPAFSKADTISDKQDMIGSQSSILSTQPTSQPTTSTDIENPSDFLQDSEIPLSISLSKLPNGFQQQDSLLSLDTEDFSNGTLQKEGTTEDTDGMMNQTPKNFESPSSVDSESRQNIFLRNVESEIEEIRRDLGIEMDPNIHFIKGNFYELFTEGPILGEGTTGTVKKCIRNSDNEPVAVKIVHYRDDLEILTLIVKEFKNQSKLHHKNIIKVYDLYIDYFKKKIFTIMELAECREMFDVLKDLGHYSEAVASGIFKQILTGINYLHLNGVCHRDLKPSNILVSEDGKIVKITDFNVSKFVEDKFKKFSFLSKENYKMWTYTGTIAFNAPEVFEESEYTESIDMWSAGVVLYIMLCGYQPFQAEYVQDLIEKIKVGKYEFPADPWDNISKQAKNLVKLCLNPNFKTRCSPSEALMHPWIANCGKISNTNIPKIVDYFNKFSKKNRLQRCKDLQKPYLLKLTRNFSTHHPSSSQTCDKLVSDKFDFNVDSENKDEEEDLEEQSSDDSCYNTIQDLYVRRGRTGPGTMKTLQPPPFILKLEKSVSFGFLEDPKYYGPYEHDQHLQVKAGEKENGSEEMKSSVEIEKEAGAEELKRESLCDITNNSKLVQEGQIGKENMI